jgi:hypothetical protein
MQNQKRVIDYTKEQLESTTGEQRELIHQISVLRANFFTFASKIKADRKLDDEFFTTAEPSEIASFSIMRAIEAELSLLNMLLLNSFLNKAGFETKEVEQAPSIIVQDSVLYFEDKDGILVDFKTVYEDTLKAVEASRNIQNSEEK